MSCQSRIIEARSNCRLRNSSARNGIQMASLNMKVEFVGQSRLSLIEKQNKMLTKLAISQNMLQQAIGPRLKTQSQVCLSQSRGEGGTTMTHHQTVSTHTEHGKVSFVRLHSEESQAYSPRLRGSVSFPKASRLQCLEDCQCRCHYRSVIRSPKYLSDWLGDFFLACSNLSWYFSGLVLCNEQTCRRSRSSLTELRYFFPPWFNHTIASFSASFTFRMLPLNISLRTRRTIPYDSPILVSVQEGNIEGMRGLLRSGTASVDDVDPYGLGLFYVSSPNLGAVASAPYLRYLHHSTLHIIVGEVPDARQP